MILVEARDLPETTARTLIAWQQEIDGLPEYEQRVHEGKRLFAARNRAKNRVFADVRRVLDEMCSGSRRCGYCEDSCADEVEHIRPKDLFPESVFCWANFLYICGPCNGPKGSQYAVFDAGDDTPIVVSRTLGAPVVPPRSGEPVFVNPRAENPLDYLFLDLLGTFQFLPNAEQGTREYIRGQYTIGVLRLNSRETLIKARRNAYTGYRARLREYIAIAKEGGSQDERDQCVAELRASPHVAVWREMQRQVAYHPELQALFTEAPEALHW